MNPTALTQGRNHAVQAAQECEQHYKRLLAAVTDYVYSVTIAQGRPVATAHGPGCEAVTGYTSSELDADLFLWYRMIFSEDRRAVTDQAEQILRGETPAPLEHRIIHKNGTIRWIRNTPLPHKDALGQLVAYDGLVTDITDSKRAEHRLDETQLRAILDNSPAAIHLKDTHGRYILANRRFLQVYRLNREDVINKSPQEIFPKEKADAVKYQDRQVLTTLAPLEIEETRFHDGASHTYLLIKFPLLDHAGAPYAICGISTDITERKKAELELQRSAAEIRDLYNNAPCGYHSLDKDGVYLQINDTELKWLGYSRDEVIGKMRFSDFLRPDGRQVFQKNFSEFKHQGWVSNLEFELVRKDGTTLAVLLSATAIKDAAGNYEMSRSTIFDVTERRRAEQALRLSEQRLALVIQGSSDGVWDWDLTTNEVYFSPRWKGMLGYTEHELRNHFSVWEELQHPADRERCRACLQAYFMGQTPTYELEHRLRHKDGTYRWILARAVALRDAKGKPIRMSGTHVDLTERKQAEEQIQRAYAELSHNEATLQTALQKLQTANEELQTANEELRTTQLQLIQAAKLESLGTLAAGVAHEVKNPLQTILMGLDYLATAQPGGNGDMALVLSDMRDAVTRANLIVRELLQLSAAADFERKEEDLNHVIERSLWLVNNGVVASKISVVRKLAVGLPGLLLDRNKMEQVFINLFINALRAMSEGGVLTVSTRKRRFGEDSKPDGLSLPQFRPGDPVVIAEVQDTGMGISEDQLPKVFDPFFTTSPVGVGTGLGLSVVKKIIVLHGGAIDIRNGPRGGVMVTLILRAESDKTP